MAKFIDYYKILGVPKDTPQSEIKAAYKKRTKQFHPDLHPDDPKAKAKFQLLNEAFEVLNDPDKRARYDQYGENWNKVSGEGFGGQMGGNPFEGGFNPFEGMGSGSFRGGRGGRYEYRFDGNEGFSDFFSQMFGGGFSGRTGARARQDAASMDSQASVDIDMYTAILGGEVIIQSDREKLKLKLKPGTQPGQKIRLKGKGNGGGDLILTLNVKLPTGLTDRQKRLLEEMRNG